MNSEFQGDDMSQAPLFAISEETFKAQLRDTFKSFVSSRGNNSFQLFPLTTIQENPLGFDDLFDWDREWFCLNSPGPPQSDIWMHSPAVVQYKAPLPNKSGLVFELPIHQYILMRAWQRQLTSSFYAFAKMKTHRDLERAKDDIFKMAFWVRPDDLGITDFSFEKYTIHVNPGTGQWYKKPVESSKVNIPLSPDPEYFKDRLKDFYAKITSHRPQTPSQLLHPVVHDLLELSITAFVLNANNYWIFNEITEDSK